MRTIYFITLVAILAVGTLLFGCGGDTKKSQDDKHAAAHGHDAGVPESNRTGRVLSSAEIDSMRVMIERMNITREEYWDGRGGVLGNEYLDLWYPPGKITITHGMSAFYIIDQARKKTRALFGDVPREKLTVICPKTLEEYTEQTGREWWHYSKIDGNKIVYQPIAILFQRGLLDAGVSHEYYEWAINRISGMRAPRWLVEGFASVLADERVVLEFQLTEFPDENKKMGQEEMEQALAEETNRKNTRIAYYDAFKMVEKIIDDHGKEKIVNALKQLGEGDNLNVAFKKSFNQSYDQVVAAARDFKVD